MNATPSRSSSGKDRLTGDDLAAMFSAAARLLERNVDGINALNVFPVPDGDTGTNMFLTLRAVTEAAAPLKGASAADVSDAMARSALMGARGNSGVVLSQFFKGIAQGLEAATDFGPDELVAGFHRAREHSYKAIADPVEGTILTVISSVAEAAQESLNGSPTLQNVLHAASQAAADTVARTPTMLDVLREAGVVDAGGQGLAVILEGVRRYVAGEVSDELKVPIPQPVGLDGSGGAVAAGFLAATDRELYGYCTQFLLQGRALDADSIRDRMSAMASSTVVVGGGIMVKVHVHTDDPGPVLTEAASTGTLSQVSIQNMDEQHVEFSAARREEADAADVAVVAVAWGTGLEAVFTDLGAKGIIIGGDTMNPSVQELLHAVESVRSENVVILPNNGNIIPAAVQAANNSEKTVRVVPSKSIPQGISAILAFNPDRALEENISEMEEAITSVRTGEVTQAVRAATVNGATVEPGRLIGLLDRELVAAGDDLSSVVVSVLEKAGVADGDLLTVYWGDRVTEKAASAAVEAASDAFPGLDVELVEGGQPHYYLIMSVE